MLIPRNKIQRRITYLMKLASSALCAASEPENTRPIQSRQRALAEHSAQCFASVCLIHFEGTSTARVQKVANGGSHHRTAQAPFGESTKLGISGKYKQCSECRAAKQGRSTMQINMLSHCKNLTQCRSGTRKLTDKILSSEGRTPCTRQTQTDCGMSTHRLCAADRCE